jgi:hypothetical protein
MSPYGVVDPAELAILAKALDDFCAEHKIVADADRERIALKVITLFRQGIICSEQLSAELEKSA